MTTIIFKPDVKIKVGKIVCVGLNYTKHIEEMSTKISSEPVLFLKPSTSILVEGEKIKLPAFSKEIHHEVEMALLIGKETKDINKKTWTSHVSGVSVALDLTLRDLQNEAKQKGRPWCVSKGFDGACPVGRFVPLSEVGNICNLGIELYKNGEIKQKGNTCQMIFPPGELLAYISIIFTLEPGDIILTGTPAGIGPIYSKDVIQAKIEKVGSINFEVE